MRRVVVGLFASVSLLAGTGCGGCGGDDDGGGGPEGGAAAAAATARLTVHVTGAGAGTVTSDGGGLACSTDDGTCTADVAQGDLELTATPDDGYLFLSWMGGGCRLGGTCALTVDGDVEVSASFVPLVYVTSAALDGEDAPQPSSSTNLWTARTDGTHATPLTELTAEGAYVDHPRWSLDGTRVLFQSTRAIAGGDAVQPDVVWNLFQIDADGTHLTAITELTAPNAFPVEAEWSPDGARIVFRSNGALDGSDATVDGTNVWVADADGGNAEPLTDLTTGDTILFGPAWSPDGERIVYISNRALTGVDAANPDGGFNLWIVGADGTDDHALTELSETAASAGQHQWAPDGTRLLYVSDRALDGEDAPGGASNVWIIDPDDGDTSPITMNEPGDVPAQMPAWAPDGAHIYYQSHAALDGSGAMIDARNLWVMDADGDNAEPLTTYENSVYMVFGPRPTPDGSAIFFTTDGAPSGDDAQNANDTTNVWGIGSDGDGLHAVTTYEADGADCYETGGF